MVPNPPCTKFCFQVGENKTSKNRKGVLGCGLAMHMSNVSSTLSNVHTTMNLPKTWWKTIQGSRLSSSQRRTCFPKTQARKGPSSNRANLHLELPGKRGQPVIFPVLCLLACGDTALKSLSLLAFGVHKFGCDNDTFHAAFPSIWVPWNTQILQNNGKCKMTSRPCP